MNAASRVRRRREEKIAQHIGHALEHCVIRRERIGVAAREFGELRLRGGKTAADDQVTMVRKRQEVRHGPRDDRKPMTREIEIADHLRVQQADRVARRRIAESRMEFLGDRGAAE